MELISRVDLKVPIDDLLKQVVVDYGLGDLIEYQLIETGYEELNIKTITSKGIYVVKIFSKDKSLNTIQDYIKGLLEFSKAGIPIPTLLKFNDTHLYKKDTLNICVTEFFDGNNFTQTKPTIEDIKIITKYLAKIHKLSFKINRNYDSWGTTNLINEFEKKKEHLTPEELDLIQPIVDEFKKLDFSKFRKSIIHGDLQRQHVLKNNGDYCILDLGCMDFNASVIDLAIFIALFALDPGSPTEENRKIYKLIVDEYLKENNLEKEELTSLSLLIQATYAMYTLSSRALISKGDKSLQTQAWNNFGRKGMEISL